MNFNFPLIHIEIIEGVTISKKDEARHRAMFQIVESYQQSGFQSAGYHTVQWDGTNESGQPVSGGLYFYELKTEHKRILKKMLLVK